MSDARVQAGFPDLRIPLQLALQHTRARRGSLLVKVDDHLVVQAARRIPRFIVARTAIPLGFGIAGWVAQQRQSLLVSEPCELPRGLALRSQGYRTTSFISTPICMGRRVIGVINVADRLDQQPFTRSDLDAILLIARQAADVTRFHQQASEAMRRTDLDPLTGLPNRRSLDERIEEEFERARRYGTALGAMRVDLNGLSAINDRYGYRIGDLMLRTVANVLRSQLRIHDVAFRSGDDEFTVLLPNTDRIRLIVPAQRIASQLTMARLPRRAHLDPGGIAANIGLAEAPTDDGSAADLFNRAGEALAFARRTGSHIETWRPGLWDATRRTLASRPDGTSS